MHIEEQTDCIVVTGAEVDRASFRVILAQAKSLPIYAGDVPTLTELRASATRFADSPLARKVSADVDMEALDVEGIPAWWFRSRSCRPGETLLYLHGGGFVCGSVLGARGVISALAEAFGAPVLAASYRQAPEHPFPAAVEDARKVYEWLRDSTGGPITLIGESAGAALALGTALAAARAGDRRVRGVIAISAWYDLSMSGQSWHANRGADLVPLDLGRFFRECYLGDADPRGPGVSPLDDDLSGAPPLLIQAGSRELALDDSSALAAKARNAGVRVRYEIYADMPHGFLKFANPIGDLAIRRMVAWASDL